MGFNGIKVYVDTDDDIRIIRRIQMPQVERGRSLDSIITQYLATENECTSIC